jgi:serine/threonine protein kinase
MNLSTISMKSGDTTMGNKGCLEDYEFVPNKKGICELGKGGYGVVKHCKNKKDHKTYAMKIIEKSLIIKDNLLDMVKREIKIQKSLHHPHVLKLQAYFEDNSRVYILLDYCENGSLFHYMNGKRKLIEDEAFIYFFQTCIGIDYLHKHNIIHRDLKPENLLLDGKGNIKISDFGWSALVANNKARNTFCGTLDYLPPEMIYNKPHSYSADLWSIGVLLYELCHGKGAFAGDNLKTKTENIVMGNISPIDQSLSHDYKDLLYSLLKIDQEKRIEFQAVFQHPWVVKFAAKFNINIQKMVYKQKDLNKSRSVSPMNRSGSILGNKDFSADYLMNAKPQRSRSQSPIGPRVVSNNQQGPRVDVDDAINNQNQSLLSKLGVPRASGNDGPRESSRTAFSGLGDMMNNLGLKSNVEVQSLTKIKQGFVAQPRTLSTVPDKEDNRHVSPAQRNADRRRALNNDNVSQKSGASYRTISDNQPPSHNRPISPHLSQLKSNLFTDTNPIPDHISQKSNRSQIFAPQSDNKSVLSNTSAISKRSQRVNNVKITYEPPKNHQSPLIAPKLNLPIKNNILNTSSNPLQQTYDDGTTGRSMDKSQGRSGFEVEQGMYSHRTPIDNKSANRSMSVVSNNSQISAR